MTVSFLIQCKQNFFEGITPSSKKTRETEGYKAIVSIAQEYFKKDRHDDFLYYLTEGQYFVSLWAAHMIVEYGNPNRRELSSALDVIREYSENPLAPNVAKEEREWLDSNENMWKNF